MNRRIFEELKELLDFVMLANADKTRKDVARLLFEEYREQLSEESFENMIKDLV